MKTLRGESSTTSHSSGAASSMVSTEKYDASFFPGRRLSLSTFNGQQYIHIREYIELNGKLYPTKKGVSFTPGRLSVLRSNIGKIDLALQQQEVNASYSVNVGGVLLKVHLGAGIYATVSEEFKGVSLRRHWMPEGQNEPVPTKNGIYLPTAQWNSLKIKLDELLATYPDLLIAESCNFTHQNQMGMLDCNECCPFGWFSV